MLSLTTPAEALSYQFRKLVAAAWVALWAQTSLKVCWNWTRCEASTGWSEVIVTGPPMVPWGKLAYDSAPGATVNICEVAPGRLTVTLAAVPPGLRTWMLSFSMPGEALSYQFR